MWSHHDGTDVVCLPDPSRDPPWKGQVELMLQLTEEDSSDIADGEEVWPALNIIITRTMETSVQYKCDRKWLIN